MLDALAKSHMAQLKDPKTHFTKDEDREYILRFFALFNNLKDFRPPLYKFLNAEIQQKQNLDEDASRTYQARFRNTFDLVLALANMLDCCQS